MVDLLYLLLLLLLLGGVEAQLGRVPRPELCNLLLQHCKLRVALLQCLQALHPHALLEVLVVQLLSDLLGRSTKRARWLPAGLVVFAVVLGQTASRRRWTLLRRV